jgi:fructoselysine-6-P-deglycase FrlB-like protein
MALLEAEMARQHADALELIEENQELTKEIAASTAATGRLVLTGMGTSHYGNRVAEAALREAGLDATAIVTSELLNSLEIPRRRTLLLVSQSGESGEIVAYLDRQKDTANEYGLTLARDSRLARARRCMVAPGGAERAFASTRSFFLQVAGLSAICRALEADVGEFLIAIREPKVADCQPALEHLAGIKRFVLSGRGLMQGIAEAAALNLMELARVPVLAQEGGQLRHGPMEILGPQVGVILLRADDAFAGRGASLAAEVVAAGSPVVVVDASGAEPISGVVTLATPRGTAFGAALGLLPTLQRLVIGLAGRLVENVGEPLRSTKVTRDL